MTNSSVRVMSSFQPGARNGKVPATIQNRILDACWTYETSRNITAFIIQTKVTNHVVYISWGRGALSVSLLSGRFWYFALQLTDNLAGRKLCRLVILATFLINNVLSYILVVTY